jgi:hypothetical protein
MKEAKNSVSVYPYRRGELAGRTGQPCVPPKNKGHSRTAYLNGFKDGKQNKKDGVKLELTTLPTDDGLDADGSPRW